jgi:hypothetical protein
MARFNIGKDVDESWIVTSTGPFIITWNLNRVMRGRRDYKVGRASNCISLCSLSSSECVVLLDVFRRHVLIRISFALLSVRVFMCERDRSSVRIRMWWRINSVTTRMTRWSSPWRMMSLWYVSAVFSCSCLPPPQVSPLSVCHLENLSPFISTCVTVLMSSAICRKSASVCRRRLRPNP